MNNLKFYYFDFCGRGEVPRMCMHIAGIPFQDVRLSNDEF